MKNKPPDDFIYGPPYQGPWNIGNMSVGGRIRKLRKEMGLTLGEFAELTGVPVSTISDLEHGRSGNPRGDTLVKIASGAKVDQDWLMSGEGLPMRKSEHRIDESELLRLYALLTGPNREVLLTTAKALLGSQPDRLDKSDPRSSKRPDLQ